MDRNTNYQNMTTLDLAVHQFKAGKAVSDICKDLNITRLMLLKGITMDKKIDSTIAELTTMVPTLNLQPNTKSWYGN